MGSPGSFDLSPVPGGQATTAVPIVVALYEPSDDGGSYTILPNVYCLRIDYREGPEPPLARFTYFMDDSLYASLGWPSQFEQLFPIDAQGDYVVLTDDRLVVLTQDPDGNPIVLFDGFAQVPQTDVAGQSAGRHVRCAGCGDPALGQTDHRPAFSGTHRPAV